MAKWLFKLGQFSARKAWFVLLAWVLILGAAGTAALTLGGTLSSSMSIDGVPSQVVVDQLKKNFEVASRGSGQVIFQKADGSKLNTNDRAAITAALEEVLTLDGVSGDIERDQISAAYFGSHKVADSSAHGPSAHP